MRKLFILIALSCLLNKVDGQDLEFGAGLNRNKFYSWEKDEGHFYTEYHPGNGFSFFLSWEDTVLRDIFVKFVLILDDYTGKLSITNGGRGGSTTTYADVKKTTLGLGFFPFNYRFLKSGWLNFGVSYNLLLNQKMDGYHTWWYSGIGGNDTLNGHSNKYKNDFTFSIVGRIAYKINLTNSLHLVPQYFINIGLSKEFNNLQPKTKAIRQTFAIGINRGLSK